MILATTSRTFLAPLPDVFTVTSAAAKAYSKLDTREQELFYRLLERIAEKDPRVEWKKLNRNQAKVFNLDVAWEAKADRKYRLFTGHRNGIIPIVGFSHRGDGRIFRRER